MTMSALQRKLLKSSTERYAPQMHVQTWLEQVKRCALSMEQRSNYAVLMGVQIRLRKEECAKGMGQKASARYTYAAVMGVQIKLRTEVYVGGMEELAYAELRDVQIKFIREECARNMAQRRQDAVVKDVQIKFNAEEFALGMWQSTSDAVVTDVQIKLRKEECAKGM